MKFQKFVKALGSDGIVYNRKMVNAGLLLTECL